MSSSPNVLSIRTPNGFTIFYFSINETLWFCGKDVAHFFGYKQTRNAISKFVSQENKKPLKELGVSVPGFKSQTVFITMDGVYEFVKNKENQPLDTQWLDFFNSAPDSNAPISQPLKFQELSQIPETLSVSMQAQGFVYLLRWKNFGKVGKTRSMKNRKQSLLQKFKEGELIWFCFCQNIDLLEREILEKLGQLGALIKHPESVELFDPTIISFEEVQEEIDRLAKKINGQYSNDHDRIVLKQEYTKAAQAVVDLLKPLSKEYPKESIHLLEQVFVNFRNF